jgi:hypothetical protein
MLLDAPLQGESLFSIDTKEGGRKKKCKSEPYLKGYRDFTPWLEATALLSQGGNQPAFQKISLIEDIIFYWTTASTERINEVLKEPHLVTCYQKHIVAATWFNTLEHLYTLLSRLETDLWAIEPMVAPHLSSKQKDDYMAYFTQALNEVNTIRRRLNWYVLEMEDNLYAMGIDPAETAQTDVDKDFLAVYRRLGMYRDWSKTVMEVITNHVNLMETEKSITDSKYLGRLTVLGFIFVPMSFVATFFSMAGDYAVGQGKFWVFFAVAFPLLALILATAFGRWCWIKFELWRKQKRERETRSRRRHTSNRNKDNKQNEELLLGT